MKREKVLPKILGKAISRGSELEPFSQREDAAMLDLIKDTAARKEAARIKASEAWTILHNASSALLTERPDNPTGTTTIL